MSESAPHSDMPIVKEVSFEDELSKSGSDFLCPELRKSYYDTMKTTVVLIKVLRAESDDRYEMGLGGGIYLEAGSILTSFSLVEGAYEVYVKNVEEIGFRLVKTEDIQRYPSTGLAVLEVEERGDVRCVKLAPTELIRTGMDVFCITSQDFNVYTMGQGRVAFACKIGSESITTNNPLKVTPAHRINGHYLKERDEHIPVIQINNTHLDEGALGCPIFTSAGLVIGIVCHSNGGIDFCIHAQTIREFIEKEVVNKKRKAGKESGGIIGRKQQKRKMRGG